MRPRDPISWLSLIGRPNISLLDGFTRSFKKFKDDFFRVRVLAGGKSNIPVGYYLKQKKK